MSRGRIPTQHLRRRQANSRGTQVRFIPTGGFTELPDIEAPPGSFTSGQNVWIRSGRLEPRWRLASAADNILSDKPNGAFTYDDTAGTKFPIVTSQGTVAYLDDASYTSLQYVSGTSNIPPTGGENDDYFGTSVYLPRRDLNIGVFTNGVDPLYAWGGPSDNTGYSTLTGGPVCADVALFHQRPIVWNVLGAGVTRVQWPVGGDPEDWVGIGSGFEDLVDMRGVGTRIIAEEDEVTLFTSEEIARGRRIGGDFVFKFSPINREVGAPWKRSVLRTNRGTFFLGSDYNIYNLAGSSLNPVGDPIQRTIRDTIANEKVAFFGFNEELQQLTFYYATSTTGSPDRAFTLHLKEGGGVWTPQRFPFEVSRSFALNVPGSSTTWGGLTGLLSAQSLTYNDLLGAASTPDEALLTSNGTTTYYSDTADTDLSSTVHSQAVFPLFGGEDDRVKFSDLVRVDVRADSASSLSVAVSGNLGGTWATESAFAVSVQSNTSQINLRPDVSGLYHAVRLESDEGRWSVMAVKLRARTLGEAF